jgi:hypothetical protein
VLSLGSFFQANVKCASKADWKNFLGTYALAYFGPVAMKKVWKHLPQTFELYRGKQSEDVFEEESRVVGKFKVVRFVNKNYGIKQNA